MYQFTLRPIFFLDFSSLSKICFLHIFMKKNISRNANFFDHPNMHRILHSSKESSGSVLMYCTSENPFQLTGSRSSTRILVRVYCDANYYGADCNTYCVGRDDSRGHYRCDDNTGNKICLTGWRGLNCLTRK